MKYFKLFIVLVFFVIYSCDKEEFYSGQTETFIKYFGSEKSYEGVQVLAAEGGGYIILGNFENLNRGQDICIVRTDIYGNTIGPIKVYGGNYDDYGYTIKKNDAGYIIAGSTKMTASSDKEVYLVQINNAGDTLWTSSFGYNLDDEAYDVLVLDNQDLVITGYSKVSENNTDFLVAKASSLGVLDWSERHGLNFNEVGESIVKAGDYFIIGGSRNNDMTNSSNYNGFLAQVTNMGKTPLIKPYNTEGNSEISSIVSTGNNSYYAACTVESESGNESKINVIKFRHDDRNNIETLWMKEYGEGEQLFNQASLIRVNNNSVTIVGTSGTNIESGDLLLMKIDLEGNSPEYSYTGDGISFAGRSFDYTPDGGYILTGSNYSNENSVITLAKLNNQGKL